MKKFVTLLGLMILFVGMWSCQKEFNFTEPHKSGPTIFMSYVETLNDGTTITTRKAVADNQVIHLPDSAINCLFWTDPLTTVNWNLSGPMDGSWETDQLTIKFIYTGTYHLQITSFGVNWSVTILVGGPAPSAEKVGTRFVKSVWDDNLFHYTFRINKPSYISSSDVLFRINELGSDYDADYLPKFSGVELVGDSIDITFSYPASGNETLDVKFIAGYLDDEVPIWFVPKDDDPYKCVEPPPAMAEIFQVNIKNGLVLTSDQSFQGLPSGASPTLGDYGQDLPVVLMAINPATNTLTIWLYSLSENGLVFRYITEEEGELTELSPIFTGEGYWKVTLPLNPPNGFYLFEYGKILGGEFIQDMMMKESTFFYSPDNMLRIHM